MADSLQQHTLFHSTNADGPPADSRIFLGWDMPAIVAGAQHIINAAKSDTPEHTADIDLSSDTIIVPTGRAQRVLLATIVHLAEQQAARTSSSGNSTPKKPVWCVPPTILTPAQAIANFTTRANTDRVLISDFERTVLWQRVVENAHTDTLDALLFSTTSRTYNECAEASIAHSAASISEHIAQAGRRIGECIEAIVSRVTPEQGHRWRAVGSLENDYIHTLNTLGLDDPLVTNHAGQHKHIDTRVYLLGITQLLPSLRRILKDGHEHVAPMVYAPSSFAEYFDLLGCCNTEQWLTHNIPITVDHIVVATDARSQASSAIHAALTVGADAVHEVTIGLLDGTLAMPLVRQAETLARERVRPATTQTVRTGHAGRWFDALHTLVISRSFADLMVFLRQHITTHWLESCAQADTGADHEPLDWLEQLDTFQREHFPGTIDELPRQHHLMDTGAVWVINRVLPVMQSLLLSDLRVCAGHACALLDVLDTMTVETSECSHMWPDVRAFHQHLIDAANVAHQLDTTMTCDQFCSIIAQQMDMPAQPEPATADTIEAVGWLELLLDPAAHCVLLGTHERSLPSSPTTHPWLTDSVLDTIGLPTTTDRRARDAYILTAMIESKQSCTLVSGTTDGQAQRILPSPLLFHTNDDNAIQIATHLHTIQDDNTAEYTHIHAIQPGSDNTFAHHEYDDTYPIEFISVTAFRTYIASPREFYLSYIMRLDGVGTAEKQLDAMMFGSLIHDVLERFGNSDISDSDNADHIRSFLHNELDSIVQEQLVVVPNTSIKLQLRAAKGRLAAFADWQAGWFREGWRIDRVEWKPDAALLTHDSDTVTLKGRIDRIDKHTKTGKLAIIDYKTGETAATPEKAHRCADGWTNLQLPLYRHLLTQDDRDRVESLMYITLPKSADETCQRIATWELPDLLEADAIAMGLVQRMRRGMFDDSDALGAVTLDMLADDLKPPNDGGAS